MRHESSIMTVKEHITYINAICEAAIKLYYYEVESSLRIDSGRSKVYWGLTQDEDEAKLNDPQYRQATLSDVEECECVGITYYDHYIDVEEGVFYWSEGVWEHIS